MKTNQLIDLILKPHRFSVFITGPWGEKIEITIDIPDLRSCPRNIWGDWGPMYTVFLPPDCRIELLVRTSGKPEGTQKNLELEHIEVQSPMLAAKRSVTPLFMEIPLMRQKMPIRIYYDIQGTAVEAEFASTVDAYTITGLLSFQEIQNKTESSNNALINQKSQAHRKLDYAAD